MISTSKRKKVAVYDPVAQSRDLIGQVLNQMGYAAELHRSAAKISSRTRGAKAADLLLINLAVLGNTYQEVTSNLEQLDLGAGNAPPVVMVTTLRISQDARLRLEQLGAHVVFSQKAPFMELMFAINRLLFPKIRELRRYTRVFGGFPIQFLHADKWHQGEVYNIGHQGAFIQCENPPPENTRLEVRFALPGSKMALKVPAHVNWVNAPGATIDQLSPHGMGVRFLVLNQEESMSIDKFIVERASENGSSP